MADRRPAKDQPGQFAWTPENLVWCSGQMAKYPAGRQASCVIPFLWRAQKQEGWVSIPAMEAIARQLGMPYIRVYEVATFYTMFNLRPVGRHFVQVCGTTPCMLRGSEPLLDICREVIGPESTPNASGQLSWLEVECLGACCNAPMAQIDDDYYEDLTPDNFRDILRRLEAGEAVKPGTQNPRRHTSDPEGGLTSLTDPHVYDRSVPLASTLPNSGRD